MSKESKERLDVLMEKIEEIIGKAGGEVEFFDETVGGGRRNPVFSLKIGMYPWGITFINGTEQEILDLVEEVAISIESDIEHLKDELGTKETPQCPVCGDILKRCPDCGTPFCRECDNHIYREVSSSEIAKGVSPVEFNADEEALKFGKIFHEAYQEFCYRCSGFLDIDEKPEWKDFFLREIEDWLWDEEIYTEELVGKAIRIFEAMVNENLMGMGIPKTVHRVRNGMTVYAKADLWDPMIEPMIEFKIGPLNDYARAQAKIQAWAYNTPVKLSGVKDDNGDQVALEVEVIKPDPSPVDAYTIASTTLPSS